MGDAEDVADAPVTDVEWDAIESDGIARSPPVLVLAAGSCLLTGAFAYDLLLASGPTLDGLGPVGVVWDVTALDWLTLLAGLIVLGPVAGIGIADPTRFRAWWARYPRDRSSIAGLAVVGGFGLVGLFGPLFVGEPGLALEAGQQPPYGFSTRTEQVFSCVGRVSGGQCHGSLRYPLGTTRGGEDVLAWLVYGTRTTLRFALVAAALMVPPAVAVGTTAGAVGGRVDGLLTSYLDVQQSVPTVIVYFVATFVSPPTLFLMVVIYGLFNWAGVARLVRTEVRTGLQEGYVDVARGAGAGRSYVLRRHVLPNTADTIVSALVLQLPKLVLIEATLSFLGLGGPSSHSWGQLIQRGLGSGGKGLGIRNDFGAVWWLVVFPTLAIVVATVGVSLFGDGLQTAMDPRRRD